MKVTANMKEVSMGLALQSPHKFLNILRAHSNLPVWLRSQPMTKCRKAKTELRPC